MLQAEEVRLGNLVMTIKNDHIITVGPDEVIYLFTDRRTHKLMGIPITDEWLEKLGFKKKDSYWFYEDAIYQIFVDDWEVVTVTSNDHICHVVCVHELQNLHFALTGEELKEEDNFIEL